MYSRCMYSQPSSTSIHQDSTQKHLATDLLDCSKKSQKQIHTYVHASISGTTTDHGRDKGTKWKGMEPKRGCGVHWIAVRPQNIRVQMLPSRSIRGCWRKTLWFPTHSSRALFKYTCMYATPRGTVFSPPSCLNHHCKGVVRELRRVRSVHSTRTCS